MEWLRKYPTSSKYSKISRFSRYILIAAFVNFRWTAEQCIHDLAYMTPKMKIELHKHYA